MDAVITWADGSDPEFRKKRDSALGKTTLDVHSKRLDTRHELRYCLRGLTYNCPWLRTIYIVTNDQWPTWLDETIAAQQSPPIRRISCREIHPDKINIYGSVAIEALLHKIPDLSDLFLYANVDMFICKPMKQTDWIQNGVGMFKQSVGSMTYTSTSWGTTWYDIYAHIEQLKLYESNFPRQPIYYREFHHVQVMSKAAIALAEQTYPDLYAKTIHSHGRLNAPHLGRRLFELLSIHLGVCKYDYSHNGYYSDNVRNRPTDALFCINLNDRKLSLQQQRSYDRLFQTLFPTPLSAEKEHLLPYISTTKNVRQRLLTVPLLRRTH